MAPSAGVDEALVDAMTTRSILTPDASGHELSDAYVARFAELLVPSGISLHDLAGSMRAGVVRFGDLKATFPDQVRGTRQTHAGLAADLGIGLRRLGRIGRAAGLAAHQPTDPVPSDEERILRPIVGLGTAFRDTDVAIRIGRIVGERTQSIASSARA